MSSAIRLGFAASLLAVALAAPSFAAPPAGRAAAPDSNQVLVRIGREAITRGDVSKRLEELPEQLRGNYATPDGRQQLLDRMIEERVWVQMASKHGVEKRPDVQKQLEQNRRDVLIRAYLNDVMAANTAPTDAETKAYYDAHLADYKIPATVTVRHIESKTEAESRRVLALLKGRQDFAKLAAKYSADTLTRANGGVLGTVTHDGMFGSIGAQPALAESAFTLREGKVGGPWKGTRGWHLIRVDGRHDESTRALDTVRPMIQRQLGSQKAQDYYHQQLDKARKELGVSPDSTAIKSFVSAKKSARDMFKDAQDTASPTERLAKYQQLLRDYPDSDVSPQSQFMIGFIYSEEMKNFDEADKAFRQMLARYPKSELAASARWMIDHMRTEDAPAFLNLGADSNKAAPAPLPKKGSSGKP